MGFCSCSITQPTFTPTPVGRMEKNTTLESQQFNMTNRRKATMKHAKINVFHLHVPKLQTMATTNCVTSVSTWQKGSELCISEIFFAHSKASDLEYNVFRSFSSLSSYASFPKRCFFHNTPLPLPPSTTLPQNAVLPVGILFRMLRYPWHPGMLRYAYATVPF